MKSILSNKVFLKTFIITFLIFKTLMYLFLIIIAGLADSSAKTAYNPKCLYFQNIEHFRFWALTLQCFSFKTAENMLFLELLGVVINNKSMNK